MTQPKLDREVIEASAINLFLIETRDDELSILRRIDSNTRNPQQNGYGWAGGNAGGGGSAGVTPPKRSSWEKLTEEQRDAYRHRAIVLEAESHRFWCAWVARCQLNVEEATKVIKLAEPPLTETELRAIRRMLS